MTKIAPARTAAALLGCILIPAPAAAQGMSALNPILMLIPPEYMYVICLGLIVAGGFAIVVGQRARGLGLVTTALMLPFVAVIAEAVVNDLFAFVPDWLVIPIAILMQLVFVAMLILAVMRMMVSQRAWDEAMKRIMVRGLEGTLRVVFTTRLGLCLLAATSLWLGLQGIF